MTRCAEKSQNEIMKKRFLRIIKIAGGLIGIFLLILTAAILWSENDKAVIEKYTRNENLPTIKNDWQGTPVDQEGRFINAEFPFNSSMLDLLKWQLSGNPQKEEKQNDAWRPQVKDPSEFLNSESNGILWLGHAGFFIRLNGVSIIIDPIFGKPPFVKTYVEIPSPLDKIRKVDYVLLSHDHRDHTDENTLHQIAGKFPQAKFLVGLKMEGLIKDWVTETNEIQTAGWFQQFTTTGKDDLKIVFVPVRHWSRRGLFDTNERLWGGFIIQSANKTIFFGGDSGYGSHYKQTAELFPEIDYFICGIGAFKPRWFMKSNHNSPDDALQAFADTKAKYLIPMHYGTFDLSDEPPGEPLRLLKEEAENSGVSDKVKDLQIFESIEF